MKSTSKPTIKYNPDHLQRVIDARNANRPLRIDQIVATFNNKLKRQFSEAL